LQRWRAQSSFHEAATGTVLSEQRSICVEELERAAARAAVERARTEGAAGDAPALRDGAAKRWTPRAGIV
jgi:hypothetical protein